MKVSRFIKFLVFLVAIALIVTSGLIATLPWWSFTVPLFLLGVFIDHRQWDIKTFWAGGLAGFFTWGGAMIFYEQKYDSTILKKIGEVMSVDKMVLVLISGCIGGVLAGLALYTGTKVFGKRADKDLEELIQN